MKEAPATDWTLSRRSPAPCHGTLVAGRRSALAGTGGRAARITPAPRSMLVALAALSALTLLAGTGVRAPLLAQQLPMELPVEVPGVTGYAPAVPEPDSVLGHRIGTRHTRPAQLVDYVREVAAASDRVVMGRHGVTHQGRPLVHAIITSPENHRRLEAIRLANLRLSDEPGTVGDAELAGMPAVVYMGYSVHGNEASGSEAALLLLYHLAAGEGPAVEAVLDQVVVILDPSLNPDGRARFVEWVNDNRGRVSTSDPQDREHNAPWPGGRTNHYLFDLNRDWLPAAHPESRGRLELFHGWRPQLHTDYHEMGGGATYFFQPGEPARDNPNTPASTIALTGEVAEYHARALDRIGALYYTREQYDDFYYGKGSTYPDVNGAVGILFEQASSRALRAETAFGELTYPFTIRNQLLTSLSTLEAAVAMRERLLRHQRDFYAGASSFARSAPVAATVWSTRPDRTRAQELARLLQRHRIRVHELARPVEAGGRRYEPGEAFIVPVDQPQARLIRGMLERRTEFQDSIFYDVSSWTLPLAYGLDHADLRARVSHLLGPVLQPLTLDGGRVVGPGEGVMAGGRGVGGAVAGGEGAGGAVAGGEGAGGSMAGRAAAAGVADGTLAYVLGWDAAFAPRALHRLLEAGVRPVVATAPFEAAVGGQPRIFDRGSIVVPLAGRDPASPPAADVRELVHRLAAEDHVTFHALSTGLTAAGPDLGSPSALVLSRPRVALLTGDGTAAYEVGAAWHLLDARMAIPVSLLDVDRVASADLPRYDVVVMAGYRSGLGERGEARLREWVDGGGTLVLTGSSVAWAGRTEWIDVEATATAPDTADHVAYADVRARTGAQAMGGAIFEVVVDTTHPVAFGLPARLPVFRDHATFLAPVHRPGVVVARYADAPLLSGFISARNLDALAASPAAVAYRSGRGRVVVLADDPAFRAFWHGTERLLLNAIFFGRYF